MKGRVVCVTGRVNRAIAWLVRVLPQAIVRRVATSTGRQYRKA
jgi:hypothetical protein